jgi:hypothetical protein
LWLIEHRSPVAPTKKEEMALKREVLEHRSPVAPTKKEEMALKQEVLKQEKALEFNEVSSEKGTT